MDRLRGLRVVVVVSEWSVGPYGQKQGTTQVEISRRRVLQYLNSIFKCSPTHHATTTLNGHFVALLRLVFVFLNRLNWIKNLRLLCLSCVWLLCVT
jgi:hypothetical protein